MLRSIALAALLLIAMPAQAAEWPDISKPPAGAGGGAQDAALVIGIGDYWQLTDIPGASQAAVDWYQWLLKTRGLSVGRTKLLRDSDATRDEILAEARAAAERVGPGGTLWFVFIGHGAPSQDARDGVLVGADAKQTAASLYVRSVSRSELLGILESGPQEHTVVLLDACFSGKAEGGAALVDGLQPTLLSGSWRPARSLVLSAGRSDQFAGPLPGAARPAFSYLLLGALRGWGDRDGDGQVTAREAVDYSSDALYGLPIGRAQTPELHGSDDALVLGRGRERGPDLSAFVIDAGGSGASTVTTGPMTTGSSGGSGGMLDSIAAAELARQQREAAEAAATEAARKEQEALARLQAERDEKLDAAESVKKREAAELWARMSSLVAAGGPEAKAVVEQFVKEYGSAKVWVEDRTGRYERAVRSPEVAKAQAWLGSYRDTGDSGREDGGGGAVSAGRAGIEWVSIPGQGIEMARSEVTVGQYRACVDAGECSTAGLTKYGSCNWGKSGRDDHPMNCVDWDQASAYARWVGGRLPTEAEWEYAAKGGQSYEYAGSNDAGEVAWTSENSGGTTHAVCGKKRNGYGLCDMSGNVWEWTSTASGSFRVFRGGSWLFVAGDARVANRSINDPGNRHVILGFRPVR